LRFSACAVVLSRALRFGLTGELVWHVKLTLTILVRRVLLARIACFYPLVSWFCLLPTPCNLKPRNPKPIASDFTFASPFLACVCARVRVSAVYLSGHLPQGKAPYLHAGHHTLCVRGRPRPGLRGARSPFAPLRGSLGRAPEGSIGRKEGASGSSVCVCVPCVRLVTFACPCRISCLSICVSFSRAAGHLFLLNVTVT
jgi:hypothetical protein